MLRKLALLSFPLSIVLYYIVPIVIFNKSFKYLTLLLGILGAYYLGSRFPLTLKYEVKKIINSQRRDNLILMLGIIVVLIFFYVNNGIENVFSEKYRHWYYIVNNQWNSTNWFYKSNQYIGMLTLFFSAYCGWLDGKINLIKKRSMLWVLLGTVARYSLGSRLFILHLVLYFFSYHVSSGKKLKKSVLYVFIVFGFFSLYIGFAGRFDVSGQGVLVPFLSSIDGISNLSLAVENVYSTNFNLEFFLYHWTPLPAFLFEIPETNLTIIKYGDVNDSSEPMPLIASVFYLQGWYCLIYFFILGSITAGIAKQWQDHKTFLNFFLILSLLYMVLIYHNHSGWRAVSRFFIILLWLKLLLKFIPVIAVKYRQLQN